MRGENITRFTRPIVKELREAITLKLTAVEEHYNITLDVKGISFNDDMCNIKLEGRVGTDIREHAQKDWDKNCWLVALKPEDFGREFSYGGDRYKIVGIKPRSSKYPLIVENMAGKKYKMPTDVLK